MRKFKRQKQNFVVWFIARIDHRVTNKSKNINRIQENMHTIPKENRKTNNMLIDINIPRAENSTNHSKLLKATK